MSPRTVDRGRRRAHLVAAATRAFAAGGVAGTTVADIVREAGMAQGTFYLYFDTKDDVIVAVVEDVAEQLLARLAEALASPGTPAERLLALGHLFAQATQDTHLEDVATFIHRRENQHLHDRFAERMLPRLLPLVEGIVAAGAADGSFDVPDTRAAAWFVLGGFRSIELADTPLDRMPAALEVAGRLALRTLGFRGEP